ncbi:hypothetical protein [Methanoculleus chikugoensis]|uniref:hypothetical protein n=1 Tax=Methanoculleus chikugoensis TaxID=118126 RepID=UPI001FB27B0A|nr:hypothetical protein [Methanoculleus chikugoensis]
MILGFGVFPQEHTCDGADRSPSITVFGARAPYLAFIMEDLDAPGGGIFTHWILWNVPVTEKIPGDLPAEGGRFRNRPGRCRGRMTSAQ